MDLSVPMEPLRLAKPTRYRCGKGHETEGPTALAYVYASGAQIPLPYHCPVCFYEWLGKEFPVTKLEEGR